MQLDCPRCGRVLHYVDKRPSFCAYCGKPLPVTLEKTAPLEAEAATLPPCDPVPVSPASSLESIAGCRLVRTLGSGGMGTVYEAEEIATGRRVALKLICPEYAGSQETVARFRQEGRLASQVVHPRCVFVHRADEEGGLPYILMELMPGSTLQDLVLEKGPLVPEDAVSKILDVIEGLEEAHRLGIIHRDVKPSNCFLEADGRVKIGDFGLSRSLMADARLTRTGAFLGTPLYASPEQIRADPVDQQTDVYSVAATLYFLLTGRAPHQTGDAAATMARIVSEDPPPMRGIRLGLSAALDEVVLRGLERDRGRRWGDLEEFREALLPFAPGRLPAAALAPRLAAFLVDHVLIVSATLVTYWLGAWLATGNPLGLFGGEFEWSVWTHPFEVGLWLVYFGVLEGVRGASLGKRLFRLRVRTVASHDAPGMPRAFLRAAVLELFLALGWHLDALGIAPDESALWADWRTWALLGVFLVGPFVPLLTMRARNGWRGLHELASGTRVINLVPRERRLAVPARRLEQEVMRPAELPERLGPFVILGLLADGKNGQVLLGQDPALGRRALLWVRPAGEGPLPAARQELTRGGRLRWLTSGRHGEYPWDAFVAPTGCALADLTARHGRLPWAEVRPLLQQLTDELAAGRTDGTLPPSLTTNHVWVQPDRRLCLLEFPLAREETSPGSDVKSDAGEPELSLVRRVAVLALEGAPRPEGDAGGRVRAPLPGQAARLLQRVSGAGPLYRLADCQQDLAACRDAPARVTTSARLAHLELLALLLAVELICMFAIPTVLFLGRASLHHGLGRDKGLAAQVLRTDVYAAAAASATPDPLVALTNIRQARRWDELAGFLEQDAERRRLARDADLRLLSRPTRGAVAWKYEDHDAVAVVPDWLGAYRLEEVSVGTWQSDALESSATVMACVVVAFFPAVWVAWAYLFRGGISYRLTGLTLVRSDGRPAARWQCALRAFLVWGPIVGLLCLSAWVGSWYVAVWTGGDAHAWAPWLSWASWWLAVLLLPVYALLALWLPERSLHDRIAGTYLVPR